MNNMTTREEVIKLKKELARKQAALAHRDRRVETQRDFTPSQPKALKERKMPNSVPHVIQYKKTPKRTENKW